MKASHLYLLSALLLSVACTKTLEYKSNDSKEVINGITLDWAKGLSEEKKNILREIVGYMVLVTGGYFTMGVNQAYDPDARSNEGPAHLVKLSDFYICSRELNAKQVVGLTDNSDHIYINSNSIFYDYSQWQALIKLMNEYAGIDFDFPTEAQWEYAARGGNQSRNYLYPGGNEWSQVWKSDNDMNIPGIPNELGLFNMADSRAEWCKDTYAEYESVALQTNPRVFNGKRDVMVVRGGCSKSNSSFKSWNKNSSITYFSYHYSGEDRRHCRSTARSYAYLHGGCDYTVRPVININNDEQ